MGVGKLNFNFTHIQIFYSQLCRPEQNCEVNLKGCQAANVTKKTGSCQVENAAILQEKRKNCVNRKEGAHKDVAPVEDQFKLTALYRQK